MGVSMLVRLLPLMVLTIACGKTVTKTKYLPVPQVTTIETPVMIPGTTSVVTVTQTVLLDAGFGISTLPRSITEAEPAIREYSTAVAKVLSIDGSAGTGFFISSDGLFLTNEHVISAKSCRKDACPGIKIVRDFRLDGANQVFTEFEAIAHSSADNGLDFTLLRVKLPAGEKVPHLKLALDSASYDLSDESRSFKVLGHPGGGALRFTNARPHQQDGFNLEILGLLIGGNSGGPMVEDSTGQVVAQVKSTRMSYVRADVQTAHHQTRAHGTSALDILRALNQKPELTAVVAEINTVGASLTAIEEDEKDNWPVSLPPAAFPAPETKTFHAALRADDTDMRGRQAIEELSKHINTSSEGRVLSSMLSPDAYGSRAPLNPNLLESLFKMQLKLGRGLNFQESDKTLIRGSLTNHMQKILFDYFDTNRRNALQTECFGAAGPVAISIIMNCITTVDQSGRSMIPGNVEYLKQQTYRTVDDFGMPMGFAMVMSIPGISSAEDRAALIQLADFLTDANNDVELMLQTDFMLMDMILGMTGPGSFARTFPNG